MIRSQQYYDTFSSTYERHRHHGYHQLIDDLEVELATRYCRGNILEAGCGTGLILQRLAQKAHRAVGIDLSGGMLGLAYHRGLHTVQGTVDTLPFPDASFDAVFSFKVLAHVPAIEQTLSELARVTKPGGNLVLEFYNRRSLRHMVKTLKAPTRIGTDTTDEDVYTRYDTLDEIRHYLPPSVELREVRGVRVVTPVAQVHRVPGLRQLFTWAERQAADHRLLRGFGGFLILVLHRR